MERINGRRAIDYGAYVYVPEAQAANMMKISVMRLRRNPVLQNDLGRKTFGVHIYYRKDLIESVQKDLRGHKLRVHMINPPVTPLERATARETVIHGLVAYPNKRSITKCKKAK